MGTTAGVPSRVSTRQIPHNTVLEQPPRIAGHKCLSGDVTQHHCPGTHSGPLTDSYTRSHSRTGPDQGSLADMDTPSQHNPGAHMRVITDKAVVINYRTCIQNGVSTNGHVGLKSN